MRVLRICQLLTFGMLKKLGMLQHPNKLPSQIFQSSHINNSKQTTMPLNTSAVEVEWPAVHYVYSTYSSLDVISKSTRRAEYNAANPHVQNKPLHFLTYLTLFKPEMRYSAGGTVAAAPVEKLPLAVQYMEIESGRYLQFTVTGNYLQLPEACKAILQLVKDGGIVTRGGWYLEHYVNRHAATPEDELTTHILVPIP